MQEEIAKYQEISAGITEKKRVYFEISPAPDLFTIGKGSYLQEMLEIVGVDNVFADLGKGTAISGEAVLEANPEIILTNVNYIDNPVEEIKSREGWDSITAVAQDQVYYIDSNTSSRATHNIVKALKEIAETVYPSFMNKRRILLVITTAITVMLLAVLIGTVGVTAADIVNIILHKLFRLPLRPDLQPNTVSIIWTLRLPRVLLAFLVGAALGASGTVIQSLLKNTLASPYTLGVSSGASFSAGLIIALGFSIPLLGNLTLPIVGFLSGLATVFAVIAFTKRVDKELSNNTIILVGMVFSLFVNAAYTILTALFRESLEGIIMWQMGSFAMRGWSYVRAAVIFIVIGLLGVIKYTQEMDLLSFGEDEAKANGVK